MPYIKPISDLKNYTEVINEVAYGNRVYLTQNAPMRASQTNVTALKL